MPATIAFCEADMNMVRSKRNSYEFMNSHIKKIIIQDNRNIDKLLPTKKISNLKDKILTAENIEYVYKRIEKLISKGLNKIPEQIKKKKSQYGKILSEIQNYLNYIKTGNFSNAVSETLKDAENKGEILKKKLTYFHFKNKINLLLRQKNG